MKIIHKHLIFSLFLITLLSTTIIHSGSNEFSHHLLHIGNEIIFNIFRIKGNSQHFNFNNIQRIFLAQN